METYNTFGSMYIISKGYVKVHEYKPEGQKALD